MKLSVHEALLSGKSDLDRFKAAKKLGFEAVEIDGANLAERSKGLLEAAEKSGIAISAINTDFEGRLLDPDQGIREEAFQFYRQVLETSAQFKDAGVIIVPTRGELLMPDLSPYKTAAALEKELFGVLLEQLANHGEKVDGTLIIEPVNRYESHFMNTVEDAVGYCRTVKSPNVRMAADLFHMNIEENDIAQSLQAGGKYLGHIHLADSNYVQPGLGHIDFKTAFEALRKIGYEKYLSVRCRVVGKPEISLAECVKFLKKLLK